MADHKETGVDVDVHNDANETKRTGSLVIRRAKAATEKEHSMTLLEGIKTYPKAIGWSMLISTCIAMEAFDLCLLNTFCKCRA
jgi:MFS transporter, SP family, general alpha glucoside:H+ symporter